MKRKVYDIIYPEPIPPGVILEKNLFAIMRDGVEIALDVYKPAEGAGRWPVILAYSGYNKETFSESPFPSFWCPNGYAVVSAQARGTGQSQGKYTLHGKDESRDGYDIVEWIAQQPWCDGNVGMMGASYFGVSQWVTAIHNPPHLKCIVPCPGWTDYYRGLAYPGGVFRYSFISFWLPRVMRGCLWPGPVPGKKPPMNSILDMLARPEDGPYYWERSVWNRMEQIKVPVLNIVPALQELHAPTHLRSYVDIKSPKKLIVSPFIHQMYMKFMLECLPINQQMLRWFDYWLKGIDTGIMDEPEVAIYDNGTGEWRYENEYPLARTEWKKWYLHPKVAASEPWGLVSEALPAENEKPDTFRHPGTLFNPPQFLGYTTAPLKEDVVVQGPVSVTFYASTTAENTADWAFFIKVGDIAPDGAFAGRTKPEWTDFWTPRDVWICSSGNLKPRFREVDESRSKPGQPWHSFRKPADLKPNVVYEFQVELVPIFNTFKKGHKIWVQIACQDVLFDSQDAFSPSARVAYRGAHKDEISVYHDSEHPSHLLLPVIPDAPEIAPVKAPLRDIVPGAPTIF